MSLIVRWNIRVTFEDVHVHPSVVEALENITFPLHYPKAFSYGILSKSTAPSILLYGPPGTGKTLLVRALARKAESKILAISGGDISDKYVGVGEKKIKNMFSLARSEYPCIIFIDEADALLCSRSPNGRSCERAYLNEFLSEMEGINSRNYRNPILIAATNRPFDMDEGILRRLGRRIMVDLPDVHAREEILKIHTRGESLDESFKISELAKNTPGYSGSDLKNLVYSAAMAAFREQLTLTKTSAGYPGPADYELGSGRVLHKRHFLHAKREIPASPIAETVAKIREFHNKFGETIQKRGGGGLVNKIKSSVSV
ncbi:uncharacterized protein FFMR_08981 [Fusarium fujikuroi]|nr:uncharacterized protein FFE2_15643 [Fusarium fujikuroi]SCO48072.1 uncharacterized protein FFMR_08981 [Fusarium fujikuroi]SCV61048.1 uncharacterized protein FFFS_15617 [Fusarium fujikuroi]